MGNEYGMSTLQVLQWIGPTLVGPLLVWLLSAPLIIYPLARWRTNREGGHDVQLGVKVALQYFALISFQLLLFAASYIIYTVLSKDDAKGSMYRMGFAFLIPAALVLGAHVLLLRRTNQDFYPIVRRLYLGLNFILTGLLGFVALVFAFQVLFRKASSGEEGRFAIAFALVYVAAWAACGIQFGRLVFGDSASAAPPQNVVPPSAPTSSTHQSGPTLPSLSTGSFPPLK